MKVQEINGSMNTGNKKKRKKRKKSLLWLKFLLAIILFGAAITSLALSALFNISHIEVEGNGHYTEEDMLGAANITVGSNGFRTIGSSVVSVLTLRDGRTEKYILNNYPYVKEVKVQFILPNKILISLSEREPVCLVPFMGTYLLMDREGVIVDNEVPLEKAVLPVVKGFEFQRYELGKKLQLLDPEKQEVLSALFEAIDTSDRENSFELAGRISHVDVSDLSKIRLLLDSRILVNLGDRKDLNYKVNFSKRIYQMNLKKDDKGVLDFTKGKNPSFIPE